MDTRTEQTFILKVSRICNLLSLEIGEENQENFYFHIQSFFRFVKKGRLLISSEDMYRCGKKCMPENFRWDELGNSVFDDSMADNIDIVTGSRIKKIIKAVTGDLTIIFENSLSLQILIDTIESEEKYRIFNSNEEFVFCS